MTEMTIVKPMPDGLSAEDVVDWTKEEYCPSRLIKSFAPPVETSLTKSLRPPLCTDIDLHPRGEMVPCPNPSKYEIVKYNDKGVPSINKHELVHYLLHHLIVYSDGRPYAYLGGYYMPVSEEEFIKPMMYDAVSSVDNPPFLTVSAINDIIAMLRATARFHNIQDFDFVPISWSMEKYEGTLIPFENGLYNVESDQLLPFTPNLFITHCLNVEYNPTMQEHPVSEIYENILPDPDTREFFFEMVGFTMYSPTLSPPAIFVIYGPGNTGKTALQQAVTQTIGLENVSKLSIAQICGKFTTIDLKDKLVNISGETGSGKNHGITYADGELIKQLSEGQTVKADVKHKQPVFLTNTAKLWFVTNTLPDFGDTSSGLYRRLYIVPCRVEQDWDSQIYSKLTTKDASEWLAIRALKAYRNFLDRGGRFAVSREMRVEASSYCKQELLMDFLEETIGVTDKEEVADHLDNQLVREIYDDYKDFATDTGGRPLGIRKFSEKLRNEFGLTTKRVRSVQPNGKPTNLAQFVRER